MSSRKSVTPLRINLRRSHILAGFILVFHGGAIVLSLVSLPLWQGSALAVATAMSLGYLLRRHGLLPGADTITLLIYDNNKDWLVITRAGTQYQASLQQPVYLQAWVVILNFRIDNRRRPIIILPDMIDPESFRRLRVSLQLNQCDTG
jgi:toxin CptA